MLTVVESNAALRVSATCDICGQMIAKGSDGAAAYDRPGGKVAFHHYACQSEEERTCTSFIPLEEAIEQLALSLGGGKPRAKKGEKRRRVSDADTVSGTLPTRT